MDAARARALIIAHSGNGDLKDPWLKEKLERGFLGQFRMFDSGLEEANFHEIMTALRVWRQIFVTRSTWT